MEKDLMIYDPVQGSHITLAPSLRVLSLNRATWKLETSILQGNVFSQAEEIYEITTKLGRSIRIPASYQVLSFNKWKSVQDVEVGVHIAVPRMLPGPVTPTMSYDELALLGHLIGDGCTLPRHAMQYTTVDEDLAQEVVQLAKSVFGDKVVPRIKWEVPKERKGGWYQVYLPPSYRLTHGVRNAISVWLDAMGAYGYRSYEKTIPAPVFAQPPDHIARFLRHLWSTDGHAGCNEETTYRSIPRIYYATSSERLAEGIQTLLLRLSINARISKVSQGTKGRMQYHVTLSGKPDMDAFIELVGIAGERKQRMLAQVQDHLDGRVANTNRDVIPSTAWRQIVVPAMALIGMTSRQMQSGIGISYAGTGIYKNAMGRERALRVATVVQSQLLTLLANSDVYWDEVVSITPCETNEIEVFSSADEHNFVANNIVVRGLVAESESAL